MAPRKQTPTTLPQTTNNDTEAGVTTDNTETDVIVDDQAKFAADIAAGALAAVNASEEYKEVIVGRDAMSVSEDTTPPDRPKSKAWTVVADLSDDEFQVEVANIDGFQMRKCLLRFRVNGVLSPAIHVMEGIRYHGDKGFQSR